MKLCWKPVRNIVRKRQFSFVTDIQVILGNENVLASSLLSGDEQGILSQYTSDWTKSYKGGKTVAFPTTTMELSILLKYCYEHNIKVVPQAGNTSLSGGSVPIHDNEFIINIGKMNKIIEINEQEAILVAEAGCILEELSNEVNKNNFIIPLDLGAKGSCMIGGNVATNAGGLRVYKYGSLHHNILGLEVVLANGTIVNMLKKLRKDNSGYPLKHMFIGSEGTLGFITKIAIQLAPKPKSSSVVLLKLDNFDAISTLVIDARMELGEVISAFEYIDTASLLALHRNRPELINKLSSTTIFNELKTSKSLYVLMEFSSSSSSDFLNTRVQDFLERCFTNNLIMDSILSQNKNQEEAIWALRENVPLSLMALSREEDTKKTIRKLYKYDIGVDKTSKMPVLIEAVALQIRKEGYQAWTGFAEAYDDQIASFELCGFGHIGDGNLHLNILMSAPEVVRDLSMSRDDVISSFHEMLDRIVFKLVVAMEGSISAEHGIGQLKRAAMSFSKTGEELAMMVSLKKMLDPKNILNPGKVIPEGYI